MPPPLQPQQMAARLLSDISAPGALSSGPPPKSHRPRQAPTSGGLASVRADWSNSQHSLIPALPPEATAAVILGRDRGQLAAPTVVPPPRLLPSALALVPALQPVPARKTSAGLHSGITSVPHLAECHRCPDGLSSVRQPPHQAPDAKQVRGFCRQRCCLQFSICIPYNVGVVV